MDRSRHKVFIAQMLHCVDWLQSEWLHQVINAFQAPVTYGLQAPCGLSASCFLYDYLRIFQAPCIHPRQDRAEFFLASHDFPSHIMTLSHLKTSCNYRKVFIMWYFLSFDDLEILEMTCRSSHGHWRANPKRQNIARSSECHLKVIARHSGAWLWYVGPDCIKRFRKITGSQPAMCDCNLKTVLPLQDWKIVLLLAASKIIAESPLICDWGLSGNIS